MTQVDFYILKNAAAGTRNVVACRLADKAYQSGHRVYLHTACEGDSGELDDLLWTFQAGSFVPHARYPAEQTPAPPVLIGHLDEPEVEPDVLINLSGALPRFFARFTRVLEVVAPDDADRERARERFRFYRERGYPLASHDLG
ncbi:MAG: DNA polymerase III subunit chi [Gammaproteobacteria bacterium]